MYRMYNRKGMGIVLITTAILQMNCQSLQTPRCEIDYEKIKDYSCYPIVSYEEWNKCVSTCTNAASPKTKPYEPNEWIRPRPYAYP